MTMEIFYNYHISHIDTCFMDVIRQSGHSGWRPRESEAAGSLLSE